ncbi:aldo/keto reductase [Caulobacter vibrioides]|uniref:Oxidoreductase, aldo/keto reductase family n=2 Tax=Caulobacter vibrioides TaxID=155892 RepID=Q9A528_CAUVC|nr:aldo/keto reductase [Caulobacter vibrioides]YP_002518097.1 Aldo-keto reductase [Caulobacter vibrioides NA1000]AAK24608.1 oxidoreductase, aldo/keto reductase family [Caulobacter vibrioides CB15]ACL96189.1 Aldo-keto reductase [Caulobacter vibrioides NA1000]ATC29484.1 aldo/keto reductase [Caulobacter vibrioides]QXZ51003.1 aldo/keto reductase [Caulobacter vibrioides]
MRHRPLGRSGLLTAPLIFGGNVFGWTADEAMSHRLLDAFIDGGFNAVDTADVYSAWVPGHAGGESEAVIGRWLKASGKRDSVLVLTKVAMWPKRPGLSAANIEAAVEESLRRLQTDYIDLYQSHQDDAETPQDETLSAFDRLVQAGKVRAVGASNVSPARLKASLDVSTASGLARYETIQPKFNLVDRDQVEGALAELANAEGLGIIPYYGLAAGFLTGKYRSEGDLEGRARGRTILRDYWNDKGRAVLAALDEAAAAVGASPAQVALAWIMRHPSITAPIASATTVEQLDDLMGAARLDLPDDIWATLDAAGR